MPNVNSDGIVTPDINSPGDPIVWSASMAQSISQGLGQRLAAVELFAGAFLNLTPALAIKPGYQAIPFSTYASDTFCTNMTLNTDGSLTVTNAGVYIITMSLTGNVPDGYMEAHITQNTQPRGQALVYPIAGIPWHSVDITAILKCAVNDNIGFGVAKLYGSSTTNGSLDTNYDHFNTVSVMKVATVH